MRNKIKFIAFLIPFYSAFTFGQVGIGTTNPTETLHVDGTFRLVDGTERDTYILTSDNDGVASWQRQSISIIEGDFGAGVDIPANAGVFLQTRSSITLPPGRYLVNVNMLMTADVQVTPNNSSFWLRSSFSDSPMVVPPPEPSADIIGGDFISANLPGSSIFQTFIGSVIIDNTSGANKTYHYIAGRAQVFPNNLNLTIRLFGGDNWAERSITAFPIN